MKKNQVSKNELDVTRLDRDIFTYVDATCHMLFVEPGERSLESDLFTGLWKFNAWWKLKENVQWVVRRAWVTAQKFSTSPLLWHVCQMSRQYTCTYTNVTFGGQARCKSLTACGSFISFLRSEWLFLSIVKKQNINTGLYDFAHHIFNPRCEF